VAGFCPPFPYQIISSRNIYFQQSFLLTSALYQVCLQSETVHRTVFATPTACGRPFDSPSNTGQSKKKSTSLEVLFFLVTRGGSLWLEGRAEV